MKNGLQPSVFFFNTSRFTSKWTIFYEGQADEERRVVEANGNCNNHNLFLYTEPQPLEEAKNYTFKFEFGYYGDVGRSIYKVTRRTSQRPHSGKCKVEG